MKHPWVAIACLAVTCVLFNGCRGNSLPATIPVSGTVTLDGKPVEGADVGFYPKAGGSPAMGQTDRNGNYALSTYGDRDGAVAGEHSVVISKVVARGTAASMGIKTADGQVVAPPGDPGAQQTMDYLIPGKYSIATESGLTASVKPGCGPVNFDLKSN